MSAAVPRSKSVAPILVGTIWEELVGGLTVGVLLQDTSGAVLAANRRAGELLGVPKTDLLNGLRPDGWELRDDSGAPLPNLADIFRQLRRAQMPAAGPFVIMRDGAPYRRLWAEVFPVPLRGGPAMVTVLHPVHTDIRRCKGLLDPLTGLPNRILLFDRIEQALTRARTHGTMTSVVLADVRRLGEINEIWGFALGDRLLAVIAERLRAELRADHTVSRYHGGTFIVVADHPHGTAEPIAERVRRIAEARVDLGAGALHPTVRTGWATSDGGSAVPDLIDLAETRLRLG